MPETDSKLEGALAVTGAVGLLVGLAALTGWPLVAGSAGAVILVTAVYRLGKHAGRG